MSEHSCIRAVCQACDEERADRARLRAEAERLTKEAESLRAERDRWADRATALDARADREYARAERLEAALREARARGDVLNAALFRAREVMAALDRRGRLGLDVHRNLQAEIEAADRALAASPGSADAPCDECGCEPGQGTVHRAFATPHEVPCPKCSAGSEDAEGTVVCGAVSPRGVECDRDRGHKGDHRWGMPAGRADEETKPGRGEP